MSDTGDWRPEQPAACAHVRFADQSLSISSADRCEDKDQRCVLCVPFVTSN